MLASGKEHDRGDDTHYMLRLDFVVHGNDTALVRGHVFVCRGPSVISFLLGRIRE